MMTEEEFKERGGKFKENSVEKSNESGIIKVDKVTLTYKPNSTTEVVNKKGGIDRNYYGPDGGINKQISNHNHGNSKMHPFGKNGEHAHDYYYESGILVRGEARELTEQERKELSDIL